MLVPVPSEAEQAEIAKAFDLLEAKLASARRARSHLQEFFVAMLDELMTGRIRVNHLDLSNLGVPAHDRPSNA
jgi:hypothetical protein